MADINNLRRQHEEIVTLMKNLVAYKSEQDIKKNAFALSLILGQLAGKIGIHLMAEDRFLYPKLSAHINESIQVIGKKFADEMGGLAQGFTDYREKYANATLIAEIPISFLNDTAAISSALFKRIEVENEVLYPLLERT